MRLHPSLATLAACLFAFAGCGALERERELETPALPEPPQSSRIVTYPVERRDLVDGVEGYASVSAIRETALYFTESGRLHLLAVEPQERVQEGQLMAQLEIRDLAHRLTLAEIDLTMARLRLEHAAAMDSPFETRVRELEVGRAEAEVRYLGSRVEAASIRAPHAGVIRRVQAQVSDLVKEFEPIIEMVDPSELELQMRINQDEYSRIEAGQRSRVEIETDRWVEATVTQAVHRNPRFDASVRREEFVVHLALATPPSDLRLGAGMAALIILTERRDTLAIPGAALREFRDRSYVRVLEGEVRREVDVKVGVRTATHAEILEGLEAGELVIGK